MFLADTPYRTRRSRRAFALGATLGLLLSAPLRSAPFVAAADRLHDYRFPAVTLVDQDGHMLRLDRVMKPGRAAVVEFFFTSCTTICGVRSAQIAAAMPMLNKANVAVDFYTVSIDPEHDTPERLRAYASQFSPRSPHWHLLTGHAADVRAVQAAFDAEDPSDDKMMHAPLTFICAGKGQPWLRVTQVVSTHELVAQIEAQVARAR